MNIRLIILVLFHFAVTSYVLAQSNMNPLDVSQGGEYFLENNTVDQPCITQAEYNMLELNCAKNVAMLGLQIPSKQEMVTQLEWPLRQGNELKDCSYYVISAFVDQDVASGTFQDYQCGSRTYDGHRGTDIAIFPYRFIKMDNNLVEVIAAAEGTILDKADGNTDKNCGVTSLLANYIMIGHPDGSRALYFHMKKNSVTTKAIGETVKAGEYLGVVGSSGNSSGPHLHFEVWSGSTVSTRIDPFSGACNLLNTTTWWKNQTPYSETAVIKVSTNSADVVVPPCPETETPNEQACFPIPYQAPGLPAGYAKFYMFLRQETAGLMATLRILNPDSTVYLSWTHNSANSYTSSWWGFTKKLPVTPGRYTFEVMYNGTTCSSEFEILDAKITVDGPTTICPGDSVRLSANEGYEFLWSDGQMTQDVFIKESGTYQVTIHGEFGCSSISAGTAIFEYSPDNGLAITVSGDTLISPYSEGVYWYLDGNSEPIDSGNVIQCHGDGLYIAEGLDEHGCHAVSSALDMNCPMTSITVWRSEQTSSIHPNPTSGWVDISLGNTWEGPVEITFTDLSGRILIKRQLSEKELLDKGVFNLFDYPDGIYFLRIQGINREEQRRLIKQR